MINAACVIYVPQMLAPNRAQCGGELKETWPLFFANKGAAGFDFYLSQKAFCRPAPGGPEATPGRLERGLPVHPCAREWLVRHTGRHRSF